MPKTFTDIPLTRPRTPLLDDVLAPADLRRLPEAELERLADELRAYLLYAVGRSGGHFGAGLGVVPYVSYTAADTVWKLGPAGRLGALGCADTPEEQCGTQGPVHRLTSQRC